MFAPHFKARVIARRLAAAALVLWLGGVGCLLGCEMGVVSAAAAEEQTATTQGDSCPAFSGHDCCHKADKADKTDKGDDSSTVRRIPGQTTRSNCCPLSGQSADSARKVSLKDAPLVATSGLPTFTPHSHTPARLIPHRSQLPDRGSTHLRCCVFLI